MDLRIESRRAKPCRIRGSNCPRKNSLSAFLVTWLPIWLLVSLSDTLGWGLSVGLIVGLDVGLLAWLNFVLRSALQHVLLSAQVGMLFGLTTGLIVGLNRGGSAVIRHYALRLVLWLKGYTPLNFIKFLDHCAGLILLKKVGGGYIFIHRMLLEYFADLVPEAHER